MRDVSLFEYSETADDVRLQLEWVRDAAKPPKNTSLALSGSERMTEYEEEVIPASLRFCGTTSLL